MRSIASTTMLTILRMPCRSGVGAKMRLCIQNRAKSYISRSYTTNSPSTNRIAWLGAMAAGAGLCWYGVSKSRRKGYLQTEALLHNLYQEIEASCGLSSGANLTDAEEDAIDVSGGSSVYGEITPQGVHELMSDLAPTPGFVFYDLGSGVGKCVLQVAIDWLPSKSVGIELAKTRHDAALEAHSHALQLGLLKDCKISFINGDIMNTELYQDAEVLYVASLCFDTEFMGMLAVKLSHLPHLDYIATIQEFPKPLPPNLVYLRPVSIRMTWNDDDQKTPVHLYGRKAT